MYIYVYMYIFKDKQVGLYTGLIFVNSSNNLKI